MAAPPPQQRLFYHLSVPYPSGSTSGGACEVGLPLVCLLHHADAHALLARDAAPTPRAGAAGRAGHAGAARGASHPRGSAVLADVLAILRQHGGGILPGMGLDGQCVAAGADTGGAGGGGGGAGQQQQQHQPTYHGEITSVRFTLRPGEEGGNYAVLLPGGGGGGGGGGGHPPRFTSLPVSGLTLHAYVSDKEADAARRRAADAAAGVTRLPFAAAPGAAASVASAASAAALVAAAPPDMLPAAAALLAPSEAADAGASSAPPPPAKRRKPGSAAAAAAAAAMIAEAEAAGYRDAAEAELRARGAL